MKKTICVLLAAMMLCVAFAGCAKPVEESQPETVQPNTEAVEEVVEEKEWFDNVTITISTVDGSSYHLPFYIAEKKGLFEEVGINIEYVGFPGGPVQMEAIESWDIGTTGIGGVLNCLIGHDGILLANVREDGASQNFWAYNDSDVVTAGQGNNTLSDQIYGSADTWRGKTILCSYGDVKHYTLVKTLEGFGLTLEDVNPLWMDASSCLASYWGGEGDITAVQGSANWDADVNEKMTKVSAATDMGLGLYGSMVANKDSLADTNKADAIVKVIELYFEMMDFMADEANWTDVVNYMVEYNNWCGIEGDFEKFENQLKTGGKFFTLEDQVNVFYAKSENSDLTIMADSIADVLKFYEELEVWEAGSYEKFVQPEHFNTEILQTIWESRTAE